MLIRNVGHLMTNPAILWDGGREIPEGIMDAVVSFDMGNATLSAVLEDLAAEL